MTRDEWLSQCEDELKKLRPHLSERIATTIALQLWSTGQDHPRLAAREYHAKQQPEPAPAVKRSK